MFPIPPTSSVYPSGAALLTYSVAMMESAPGLFSTTTGWPMRSASFWLTTRARISLLPPGGYPTTNFTGLLG